MFSCDRHHDGMSDPSRRRAPPPAPWVGEVLPEIAGLGLLAVIVLAVTGESTHSLQAPGGGLTFAGRLAGLTGTYLLLLMIVLIGRLPLLERTIGQDRLVRWHRQLGPWPICLLGLHAILITAGYANARETLANPEVLQLPDRREGVRTFDIGEDRDR